MYTEKKIEKADAPIFVGLDARYGKDKTRVFFAVGLTDTLRVLDKADAATFEPYKGDDIDARDKNSSFNFGTRRGGRN